MSMTAARVMGGLIAAADILWAAAVNAAAVDGVRRRGDVTWLADPARAGSGLRGAGLDAAAGCAAQRYDPLGPATLPGAEHYFQPFTAYGPEGRAVEIENVIGVLPGANPAYAGQAIVVSAHYDHLGRGWPAARSGEERKIHPGADDNASGVAVVL